MIILYQANEGAEKTPYSLYMYSKVRTEFAQIRPKLADTSSSIWSGYLPASNTFLTKRSLHFRLSQMSDLIRRARTQLRLCLGLELDFSQCPKGTKRKLFV